MELSLQKIQPQKQEIPENSKSRSSIYHFICLIIRLWHLIKNENVLSIRSNLSFFGRSWGISTQEINFRTTSNEIQIWRRVFDHRMLIRRDKIWIKHTYLTLFSFYFLDRMTWKRVLKSIKFKKFIWCEFEWATNEKVIN